MAIVELEYPKIERLEGDERYGRFVVEPLAAGYGTTLGNSLRRVLLSSLPGAAITAARIRGVAHEFSTIPGVKEDVVQIVLNLKQIRLRSFAGEPVTLTLEKEGPGPVTAGDIQTTSDVEIIDPTVQIATLEPEASLWIELTVENGRGFTAADRKEGLPIGVIPIDALFSPVKQVNFRVENTRVGQVTNYDRLILEIWTDGTTPPDEAIAQGAQILVQQFSLFAGLTRSQAALAQPARQDGQSLPAGVADMPIEELDLPQRAFNSLKRHGITKVGQLLQTPDEELLRMRNFGKKSLDEIKERLAARGLIEAPVRDENAPIEDEDELRFDDEVGEGEALQKDAFGAEEDAEATVDRSEER
ncbi:MAG TPA: DNA-directed RNA polymerase subunit alpha [Candidatus Limnocylindria bacterium]|nr:DNA-directed RNA polymerase subunit alpha [Candidatus Limnocylindria bacterium]